MKALLLILGLTLSLGIFAADEASRLGEDPNGCGGSDELKDCKCIKQDISDEEATADSSGSDASGTGQTGTK